MLHKTKGIVLRTVKYGETSVVATIFTELFGVQTYLVNGVRTSRAKSAKGNLLHPPNMLEMVVYHHAQKNLQRISEFRLSYIYQSLHYKVIKNTIALYIAELLSHILKQPETHTELYYFSENILQQLDLQAGNVANFPLFFTLKIAALSGFNVNGKFSAATPYLDLQEGSFVPQAPSHPYYLEKEWSEYTHHFLQMKKPEEAMELSLNKTIRWNLLMAYLDYIRLHVHDFTPLKSPAVLHEILD